MKTAIAALILAGLAAPGYGSLSLDAKKLKPAYDLWQKKEGKECLARASALKLADLKDHAQAMRWECARLVFEKNPEFPTSEQLRAISAETALLETKDPGSVFQRDALRIWVWSEQAQARRLAKQGKRMLAYQTYTKAVLRAIQSAGGSFGPTVAHIPATTVTDFAELIPKLVRAKQIAKEEGDAWILRLIQLFPRKAKEAEILYARFPELGNLAKLSPVYEKFVATYKAPDLDTDLFDQGWKIYLEDKASSAREKWEELIVRFPKSSHRFRALYWIGESHQRDGSGEKAKIAWSQVLAEAPLTYYAILSYFRLKAFAPDTPFTPALREVPPTLLKDPYLTPLEIRRVSRLEALNQAGLHELAQKEASGLTPRETLTSEYLVSLATAQSRAGAHWAAFPVLSEIIQRRWEGAFSTATIDLVFPQAYWPEIKSAAETAKLDPILFLGLVKQESGFETRSVSVSNAYGLSQLIWSTALDLDPDLKRSDLYDNKANLALGAKYLAQLNRRFDDNWFISLSGYNWGPTAALRFYRDLVAQAKIKIGGLEFIESVPIKETREYTAAILRNYYWYSRRITKTEITSFDPYWKTLPPPKEEAK